MAKKGQKVILENIELQPQVIGLAYKKKSNLGRVIFIFIVLGLAIYYINDISVFINDLLGRETAKTIQNGSTNINKDNNDDSEVPSDNETEEVKYYEFSNNLEIKEGNLTLNNFNIVNSTLSFTAVNSTNSSLDLSTKKYFIELYDGNKTLLNRFKVDFGIINANTSLSLSFDLSTINIKYINLSEKTIADYPAFELTGDSSGMATLTCIKGTENIIYTFKNNELKKITDTIIDNNITDVNYTMRLNSYQNKVNQYNNINGINAIINSSLSGYTVTFNINLEVANIVDLNEKYYYKHLEKANVVNFEMETYGFTCK